MEWLANLFGSYWPGVELTGWTLIKIVAIVAPLMGAIAESRADVVVLTDDNPRTESSRAILEQILAGIRDADAVHVLADRAEAIHFALMEADAGDVVVIAGKGHEDYQVVGQEVRPFSDRAVVLDALGAEA